MRTTIRSFVAPISWVVSRAAPDAGFPADSDLDLMLVVDRPTTTKDRQDESWDDGLKLW